MVKKKKSKTKKIRITHTKKENITKKLNINQEKFCRLYAQNNYLFGNAVLCYAASYGYDLDSLSTEAIYKDEVDELTKVSRRIKIEDSPYDKAYHVCQSSSYNLLSNTVINDRINELLREVMTEERVDAEISHVMMQKEDLGAKMRAISEFNKLKGRIVDKKQVDVTGLNLKELYDTSTKEGSSN